MAWNYLLLASFVGMGLAQFPPKPEGVTTLRSKLHENVTLSFKEPKICETTPGVKSYSGYVHLPERFLDDGSGGEAQDYPINTFFWFFESRKDPINAPLAIWLNGGPGGSSLMGLLQENGPCFITSDSKSTYLNPWSWNNEVNILYIDQPNQVGFSYDIPTNATMVAGGPNDPERYEPIPWDSSEEIPEANLTSYHGTFASQKPLNTANTTALAAHALWHFAQTWFFEFPYYKPHDNRISLWAESYGGHYGPGFFSFFQQQNEKIANGSIHDKTAHYLHLDTLGISYGVEIFNKSLHDELLYNWTRPNGCRDQIKSCQDELEGRGPVFLSLEDKTLSQICTEIDPGCQGPQASQIYQEILPGAGWYDVTHPKNDPFPAPYMYGYLTQESVLGALGVRVNFSESSTAVGLTFQGTLDIVHGGFLQSIGYLLDSGVKVHMMYGDRDYPCNWVGGEAASLAVPYSKSEEFAAAGYAPLVTAEGVQGMTRQFGNFSFTRVFQAGHEVPSYQPVAAYEIFKRATFGLDVPTGLIQTGDDFATTGPKDIWFIKGVPPVQPRPECYILSPLTCVPDVWNKVLAGAVKVKDWFVIETDESDNYLSRADSGKSLMEEL
ncbi:serine carboxypeptidase [Diaporthe helianthi]|uniref:Carboxypeptidase n=1 Tax=Diaporthe helianthi TaxID=158607 RepID=A0A2P5I2M5_DIAHE|nr:serine carboxypeptidase [Diaporthe helianthi]